MLILPALVFVAVFTLFVTAVIRPPTRPAALLGVYLLCYANIVLAGQVANTFKLLNQPWIWLLLQGLLAVAAWLVWLRAGRPSLKAPWVDADGRILPASLRGSLKTSPQLWLLGIAVALAFLFSLVLLWVVPPNNNDSLATHMSRVAYWMQRGSFFPWPTNRVWQVTYPVDMQLQMFWTVVFLGVDRMVEIVQWLGALAALVSVFGLARLLGASRSQALFAGLLWATFPEIILESTTTQNDLVAGTLFAAMLYLLFLGLRQKNVTALGLSALALGLGIGTKQTLFFLLPGLALVVVLAWIWEGKGAFRRLAIWAAGSLAAFVLLGLYMFVVNQVSFGHPMGPETAIEAQTGGQTSSSLVQNLSFNTFRLAYQSIDPTGLPDPLCGYSFKLKGMVFEKITSALHFPVEAPIAVATSHTFVLRERYVLQEDAAWYGPLFALLVLPSLFYHLVVGWKRKDALRVGIFILALTFLVMDAVLRPGWDPFQGRYFIPVVTISTALATFFFRPGKAWAVAGWILSILAIVIAVNTFLLNSSKPITGQQAIWSMDRVDMETIQSFYMRKPVRFVEKVVPADATLGLLAYGSYLEYPFFREDYRRRLVQIYPDDRLQDVTWLRAQGVEYVAVELSKNTPTIAAPKELVPIATDGDWMIYTWAP